MGRPRGALRAACLVALVALVAGGCARSEGPWADGGAAGLRVVATTTVVGDLVAQVGGDRVDVVTLLKPGVDAHDYEPSPADIEAIANAQLVVENGVGLESWLADTIESSGYDGPVVDASQGVALRQVGGAPDPHIWQDPGNAMVMAANIEHGLAGVEPGRAGAFAANLAAYTKELHSLDAQVERQTAGLASRKLVTNHDAFGYYLDRYHLELVGSVIPSFDSSAELSGRDLRDLVAKVRATRATAIFSETSLPPKAAETIGREAGVRVVTGPDALYGDALGPPGSDGDTYVKMIEHNTRTIVSNLSAS
jgi:zinc/manganese transport system substrate-binding protein/manganese/iron transport system substrate-binding protein